MKLVTNQAVEPVHGTSKFIWVVVIQVPCNFLNVLIKVFACVKTGRANYSFFKRRDRKRCRHLYTRSIGELSVERHLFVI